MTKNEKEMIKLFCDKKYTKLQEYILFMVSNNHTESNEYFCKQIKDQIERKPNCLDELPANIKTFVRAEEPFLNWNSDRFLITKEIKKLYETIRRTANTQNVLKEMGLSYKNITLLSGESGIGKTEFARYVAKEFNLPLLTVNFSYLISSYMGKTGLNISNIFTGVTQFPCILLLDEIDAVAVTRNSSNDKGSDGELARVTITLMQEFDNISSDVIVIACTNRPDRIDKALYRRFTNIETFHTWTFTESLMFITNFVNSCDMVSDSKNVEEYLRSMRTYYPAVLYKDILRAIVSAIESSSKKIILKNEIKKTPNILTQYNNLRNETIGDKL